MTQSFPGCGEVADVSQLGAAVEKVTEKLAPEFEKLADVLPGARPA